jgi:hypothetical protein
MSIKIYVITSGEYSDYNINCVFSTRQLAEAYVEKYSAEEMRIEEYELDTEQMRLNDPRKNYRVRIYKNGDAEAQEGVMVDEDDDEEDDYFYQSLWNDPINLYLQFVCLADSKEHAIKIANEKRIQHIANNTWGINGQTPQSQVDHRSSYRRPNLHRLGVPGRCAGDDTENQR